ncbi:uncharacterized protein [Haliaeetus albicilla]|uniref:uncharacterized protein n=1 Tax=Haliaeetus albicilla TaxID=8969 RepID=UPI0037E82921
MGVSLKPRPLQARGTGGAVAALGGALPPTLAQLGRGRTLVPRLRGVLDSRLRQKEELEAKVHEAAGRREQLRQRVEERRREQLGRQGALRRQEGAVQRVGAGCRLYQTLSGVRVLPPPPTPGCQDVELELGPPPGLPENFPTLRLRRSAGGGPPLPDPAPLPCPPRWARGCWSCRGAAGKGAPCGPKWNSSSAGLPWTGSQNWDACGCWGVLGVLKLFGLWNWKQVILGLGGAFASCPPPRGSPLFLHPRPPRR